MSNWGQIRWLEERQSCSGTWQSSWTGIWISAGGLASSVTSPGTAAVHCSWWCLSEWFLMISSPKNPWHNWPWRRQRGELTSTIPWRCSLWRKNVPLEKLVLVTTDRAHATEIQWLSIKEFIQSKRLEDSSPILTALWMRGFHANCPPPPLCESLRGPWGVKFRSGADTPLEVVLEAQHWWTEPVWMDKPLAQSRGVSAWQCSQWTVNKIQRNVPQSNVICPNQTSVTVTVFGNLYEQTNTTVIRGDTSPVLPTPRHISAWKAASVLGKKLEVTKCLCWIEVLLLDN